MFILVLIVHIIVCLFLIVVVLLQSGKAADLAGAFGGMGSQTAFGPRGSATLLSKATTISAALFMVTSLSLSILATRQAGLATTVLEGAPASAPIPAKTQPAQPQPQQRTIEIPLPKQDKNNTGKPVPLDIPMGQAPSQQQAPAKQAPAPAKK
jgi:preprotein translocase subunit SecG